MASMVKKNAAPKAELNVLAGLDGTLQNKFLIARRELSAVLIERDDEVDLVLTALLCQEHPLLVGLPGTAKSLLLDNLMLWMGSCVKFPILFNKFTTPEEVFGPISVNGLKQDQYRRVTTDMLPEAHLAFADEIFKASSAILNTLLRVLNERTYNNGGTVMQCPLKVCVAASNEWPGDDGGGKELAALFDRFLFRRHVKNIASKEGARRLWWGTKTDQANGTVAIARSHKAAFSDTITPAEIDKAHGEVKALAWTTLAMEAFEKIIDECHTQGIFPGDRRQHKCVTACQGFAYLNGAARVETEHLEILSNCLWDDQEQAQKVQEIVSKIACPDRQCVIDELKAIDEVLSRVLRSDPVSVGTAIGRLSASESKLAQLKGERSLRALAFCRKKSKELHVLNATQMI